MERQVSRASRAMRTKQTSTVFVWIGAYLLLGLLVGGPPAQATHPQVRLIQETLATFGGPAGGGNPLSLLAIVGEPVGGWATRGGVSLWVGFKPPPPGLPPGTRTIVVQGTVDDPNTLVVVNGVAASRQGNSFQATGIRLLEGPNLVRVTAIDPSGNQASREITVWLDTHPPARPTAVAPAPLTGPPSYQLTGTKIPGTSLWINGKLVVPLNDQTTWTVEVVLVEGDNVLAIVAKDTAGNISTSVTITVILDNLPPVISDLAYIDPEGTPLRLDPATSLPKTNFEFVTIRGESDDSATGVIINDRPARRVGLTFEVAVPLQEGSNDLLLVATSPRNHVTTQMLKVLRGTIPTITDLTPRDGSLLPVEIPSMIAASATDKDGNPLEYQLWLDGQLLLDWTPEASVAWTPGPIQDGVHLIEVRVRDGFGGVAVKQAELFVVLKPILPSQ